jgi:hypothetical protein
MDVTLSFLSTSLRTALDAAEGRLDGTTFRQATIAGERLRRGIAEVGADSHPGKEAASLLAEYGRLLTSRLVDLAFDHAAFQTEVTAAIARWKSTPTTAGACEAALDEADALLSFAAGLWRAGHVSERVLDSLGSEVAHGLAALPADADVAEYVADIADSLAPDPDKPLLFRFWSDLSQSAPSRLLAELQVARSFRRKEIVDEFLASVDRMEGRARSERGWPEWIARVGRHVREVMETLSLDLPQLPAMAEGDDAEPPEPRPRKMLGEATENLAVSLVRNRASVMVHVESKSPMDELHVRRDAEPVSGRYIGRTAWEADACDGCWLVECNGEAVAFRLSEGR